MPVAELRIFHSRQPSATRRVSPDPVRAGGARAEEAALYLACLVLGAGCAELDPVDTASLPALLSELEQGRRPPRALRHRLQEDRHGLDVSVHRLLATESGWRVQIDAHGPAAPQAVGALVALASLPEPGRRRGMHAAREVVALAAGEQRRSLADLHTRIGTMLFDGAAVEIAVTGSRFVWALETLGLDPETVERVSAHEVQRAYRRSVRAAHPDHGAADDGAGERLMALQRARSLLLEDL